MKAIEDTKSTLQTRIDAMRDYSDLSTDRERTNYIHTRDELQHRLRVIRGAVHDLDALAPELASVSKWCDYLTEWRKEFVTEMTALPAHARDRTDEQETRMMSLVGAIKNIDFGCEYFPNNRAKVFAPLREKICSHYPASWTMESLCPWQQGHGCLPRATEQRDQLIGKRDKAQSDLDNAVREPEL